MQYQKSLSMRGVDIVAWDVHDITIQSSEGGEGRITKVVWDAFFVLINAYKAVELKEPLFRQISGAK